MERLKEGGKVNSSEKIRLKDILETREGKPKEGETMVEMKKELKRLKVVENREEPFSKETQTFYTKVDDGQSRYDNWRQDLKRDGFRRSDLNPNYFRMDLRRRWIRDDSKIRGRSASRPGSQGRPSGQGENGVMKRIEGLEKENKEMKKKMDEMTKEMSII